MRRLLAGRLPDLVREVQSIVAGYVSYPKTFISTSQNGAGAPQNIAHGLSGTPSKVVVVLTGGHNGAGAAGTQAGSVTQGVHTATDVNVTVTQGCTYQVIAYK